MQNRINHILSNTNGRSILIAKNILASVFIKGWSISVGLLMVPLTLSCLGQYQNGVWLTISSLLLWIDQMDIGLGNGLRNSLATHMAHKNTKEARVVVSSTVAMLCCIMLPIVFILLFLLDNSDIYVFLNVDSEIIPDLRVALMSAVTLVCLTFVMKFINNVFMGMQMPAISNLIMTLGQTLAFVSTWLLLQMHCASFFNVVLVNTAAPLFVYVLAYPYTFWIKFPQLKPNFKDINLVSALKLGNLGVKFFWLQIAGLVQFMTANILISKFFTPEMVTPYQISYRYMSLVLVVFTIVCAPFWNATTDAYERGDIEWIKNANRKMNIIILLVFICLCLMVIGSPWIYDLWIGENSIVSLDMTIMMAFYLFLLVLSLRYSCFLNGIGALRLQNYMTVMAVIFIPLAWYVSNLTHDIMWFMAVMCFCNIPGIIVNIIQFDKILKGKALGLWRK